jgi:hypothetical protein
MNENLSYIVAVDGIITHNTTVLWTADHNFGRCDEVIGERGTSCVGHIAYLGS